MENEKNLEGSFDYFLMEFNKLNQLFFPVWSTYFPNVNKGKRSTMWPSLLFFEAIFSFLSPFPNPVIKWITGIPLSLCNPFLESQIPLIIWWKWWTLSPGKKCTYTDNFAYNLRGITHLLKPKLRISALSKLYRENFNAINW